MQLKVSSVPADGGEEAVEELNKFLRSHRVLSIEKRLMEQRGYWSFCVEFLERGGEGSGPGVVDRAKRGVDYKEILSAEDFAVFAKLRDLRKEMAETFLKMDVRKYFDSIPHERMLELLARLFKDPGVLRLFENIVRSYETRPGLGLPIGSLTSQTRVIRGGSWNNNANNTRCANRNNNWPNNANNNNGFRLARVQPAPRAPQARG